MRMKTRSFSRKPAAGGKAVAVTNGAAGRTPALAAKLRKKWRFAPDAIGMFSGPRDLSLRKGI